MERFWKVDDVDGLNVALVPHADPQEEPATQRSLQIQFSYRLCQQINWIVTYAEPVSNMTSKDIAGVPIANEP